MSEGPGLHVCPPVVPLQVGFWFLRLDSLEKVSLIIFGSFGVLFYIHSTRTGLEYLRLCEELTTSLHHLVGEQLTSSSLPRSRE